MASFGGSNARKKKKPVSLGKLLRDGILKKISYN